MFKSFLRALGLTAVGVMALSFAHHASAQSCQPQKQCDGAMSATQELKNGLVTSAQAATDGMNMTQNSFNLAGVAAQGGAADTKAASYCQQQLSQCDTQCKETAQACKDSINKNIANSNTSAANLAKNSDSSKDSGNNSSGFPMMPMMPSPSPSPAATPSPTPQPTAQSPAPTATPSPSPVPAAVASAAPTAGVTNCTSEMAYLNSACTGELESQCNGKFRSSGACDSFSNRYCSGSGNSGLASPGAMTTGQGVGTAFCSSYLSQTSGFQCTSATAMCPSCTHAVPVAGAPVPEACMSDPAYANPAVASATAPPTTAGGGGTPASTSGGSLAGVAGAIAGATNTKSSSNGLSVDGKNNGNSEGMSMGTAGSAGGGGFSGSNNTSASLSDLESSFGGAAHSGRGLASEKAGTALAANVTDVEIKKTANVFSISSEVLRNRCDNGKLLHCVAKKK